MKRAFLGIASLGVATALSGCFTITTIGGLPLDPSAPDWDFATYLPDPNANTAVQDNPVADASFRTIINGVRTNAGVLPLTWNTDLEDAAQSYAGYLVATDQLSHTAGNSTLADRVNATGYAWRELAENLAKGYTSEASVVTAWEGSPGHNANMINGNVEEFGLGISGTGADTVWVLVLADPL